MTSLVWVKNHCYKSKKLGHKRQNKKNCPEIKQNNIHHRNRFSYLYHIEEEKGEDKQRVCEFVVFSRSVFCPPSPRDTKQPSPPLFDVAPCFNGPFRSDVWNTSLGLKTSPNYINVRPGTDHT